jgi:Family of unknown function (DUF6159)
MGKISRTWSLMSESWQILKQDKSLLVLPLISGICCLMLLASFAIPIWATGVWRPPNRDAETQRQILYYGTLFLFYFFNYLIVLFFNSAVVACAASRMSGGDPTLSDGLRTAGARIPVIIGWALVSATVGLILRIIEDRSAKIGQIVSGLLGMAWTVISFLVVPILVIENKGPIAALKDSTALLKRTWGEQLVSHFSFGFVFFLLGLPAFAVIILGGYLASVHSIAGMIVCFSAAVIYLIVLGLIQSTLQSIFQTALYLYARDGQAPMGFNAEVLGSALRSR